MEKYQVIKEKEGYILQILKDGRSYNLVRSDKLKRILRICDIFWIEPDKKYKNYNMINGGKK